MKRAAILSLCLSLITAACGDPVEGDLEADTDASADIHANADSDAGSETDTSEDGDAGGDTPSTPLEARDDWVGVVEGERVMVDVAANDGGEGPYEIDIIDSIDVGAAEITPQSTLSFQAPDRFNGYRELVYEITDSTGAVDRASLHVGVYASLESVGNAPPPMVEFPRSALLSRHLGVVINENDPASVAVGEYYVQQRKLPEANVIRVQIPTDSNVLAPADFEPIRQQIEDATPAGVEAYALTWIKPYRVGCMSITSAVSLGGYDDEYCNTSSDACSATSPSGYYDSDTLHPLDEHSLRPSMILGGVEADEGRALVDRGLAATASFPSGTAHLVRTTDTNRSVRWSDMATTESQWSENDEFDLLYTDNADGSGSNVVKDQSDVLFYFTGLASVSDIDTNTYVPGAVADHLTSFGGRLTSNGGQMSVLRWLEAGATGSYGTVVEPCNYRQKFPTVSVFLDHYFRGDTLVEAYWKSVQWPGEGVFVGDPLARPWGRHFVHWDGQVLTLETTSLEPGTLYEVVGADNADAPMQPVQEDISIDAHQRAVIAIDSPDLRILQLRPQEQ